MLWLGLFGIVGMGMSGIRSGRAGRRGSTAGCRRGDTAEAPTSLVSATGVVQQVKAEQGKVKIDHDPIPALGWPKMNDMYFRVKDKAVLEGRRRRRQGALRAGKGFHGAGDHAHGKAAK